MCSKNQSDSMTLRDHNMSNVLNECFCLLEKEYRLYYDHRMNKAGWFLSSKDGTHFHFCCFDGCFLIKTSQIILIVCIHLLWVVSFLLFSSEGYEKEIFINQINNLVQFLGQILVNFRCVQIGLITSS